MRIESIVSRRSVRRFLFGRGGGVGAVRVAALSAALLLPGSLHAQQQPSISPPAPVLRGNAMLQDMQDAFNAIADTLEPAVVTILSSHSVSTESIERDSPELFRNSPFGHIRPHRSTGTGSGLIISKDGWVLTNDHVVAGADRVIVRLHDGREFVGKVRRDPRADLALVKIEATTPFPVAKLGDSDTVKIGNWAIAIGSPYRFEGSFSVGVISSLLRTQEIPDPGTMSRVRFYPNMIQTDAAINPGNSGGPLCNIQGEVIGINTAIQSETGGSVGIGLAIPINTAKFSIAQLMTKGYVTYGYLGVKPKSVTPREAIALKVTAGAEVEDEPQVNTPADKAGLHAGDVVIAINHHPIRNDIDLRTVVAQTTPQTSIDITLVRSGKETTVKATLTEAPKEEDRDEKPKKEADSKEKPKPESRARLGIEVQPLTDKLAEDAQVSPKTQGVVVKSIDPNTAAAEVPSLYEGHVILKINDIPTPTVSAFKAAVANLKSGDLVRVLFQNANGIHFVVIPVD